MSTQTPPEHNRPDAASLAHQRQSKAWKIVGDCYEGPLRIEEEGQEYLPMFPAEQSDAYADRLAMSVFFNAFERTVKGLTGMVHTKPAELHDSVPEQIARLWDNIDLKGGNGALFCQERHTDGERDGHFIIFVDMSAGDPDVETRAQQSGRPYWIGLEAPQVIGHRVEDLGDGPMLVHFRYQTAEVRPSGEYGETQVQVVREYNLVDGPPPAKDGTAQATPKAQALERHVTYRVWEKRPEGKGGEDHWEETGDGVMLIDRITVAVGYIGDRLGEFESKPPHLSLALENVKHYQLTSDNDAVLHVHAVPQLAIIGGDMTDENGEKVEATPGPNAAWELPLDGDLKYVVPDAAGLEAMEHRIEACERRMMVLGLSTLVSQVRRTDHTATAKRIDKGESDSALSRHATAAEDAFNQALEFTAMWMDVELPKVPEGERLIGVSRDFENVPIDSNMLNAWAKLAGTGFPKRTIVTELKRGRALAETTDEDDVTMQWEVGSLSMGDMGDDDPPPGGDGDE